MKRLLVSFSLIIFVINANAAYAAYNVKEKWQRTDGIAGETITTGALVCFKTDGLIYIADNTDATLRPAVGMANNNGDSGVWIEVITSGIMSGWAGLTVGGSGYLSAAGAVSESPGAYAQVVGIAISASNYLLLFSAGNVSGAGAPGGGEVVNQTALQVQFTDADSNKTHILNGSGSDVYLCLFDAAPGTTLTIIKSGTGDLTIYPATADGIYDDLSGGGILTNSTLETSAVLNLLKTTANNWIIKSATGSWTTGTSVVACPF